MERNNAQTSRDNPLQTQYDKDLLFKNLIWDLDDVCEFTGYARGTIYNLVSKGVIPHRKRGRGKNKLIFIPSEVIAWFKGELE